MTIEKDGERSGLSFQVRNLINAGYTGRDREEVKEHIRELGEEGVSPPDKIPVLLPKANHLIMAGDGKTVEVLNEKTSGEVEYVLLVGEEELYIGVGSDHTDRELEGYDVSQAKQSCPNLISETVWPFEAVKDHWDDLKLRSWNTRQDGERILYQDSSLEQLMRPERLLEFTKERLTRNFEGTVLFSGSVPTETDGLIYGQKFETALIDEGRGKSLECSYRISPLDWLEER